MKSIVLRGPFLTSSGYGVHSRQIAKYFLENFPQHTIRIEPLPWGMTSWKINPQDEDGLIGRIMSKTGVEINGKPGLSVQVQLPHEWDPNLANVNIGVTAGIETDVCNPEWIKCINRMDKVIVPSQHSLKTFENTGGLNTPVVVIPESYSKEFAEDHELDMEISTKFNFLLVGQLTAQTPDEDRKNTFFAIKWFCEAFKGREDVGLVVKTNRGKSTTLDFKIVSSIFNNLVSEVREGEFPKVHLLHGNLTNEQMSGLYKNKNIKALLAPTKGEGYGLPILEASVCGLPVIATNWSGHLDFMNHGKFIPVEYFLSPISEKRVDGNIFVKGAKWALPNEMDFKSKCLKFVKKGDSIPKKWAKDLSKKLLQLYSFKEISNQYNNFFKEIVYD